MIYEKILEYLELQIFVNHDCLCIIKSQNLKTIVEQALAFEVALNSFAR